MLSVVMRRLPSPVSPAVSDRDFGSKGGATISRDVSGDNRGALVASGSASRDTATCCGFALGVDGPAVATEASGVSSFVDEGRPRRFLGGCDGGGVDGRAVNAVVAGSAAAVDVNFLLRVLGSARVEAGFSASTVSLLIIPFSREERRSDAMYAKLAIKCAAGSCAGPVRAA